MLNNPMVKRYAYSSLRRSNLVVGGGIYASILILLFLTVYAWGRVPGAGTVADRLRVVLVFLLIAELLALWAWGGYQTASTISNELRGKSYDFLQLVPLSARRKVAGILIGRNLLPGLFGLVNAVVGTVLAFALGLSWVAVVQTLMVLFSVWILICTAGLLSSTLPAQQKQQRSNAALLLVLSLILFPMFLGGIIQMADSLDKEKMPQIPFFQNSVPIMVMVSAYALYLSAWAFRGAMRKIDRPGATLFPPGGAALFFVGGVVVVFGLFWKGFNYRDPEGAAFALSGALGALLLLMWFILAGSLRDAQWYLENLRPQDGCMQILARSNLATGNVLLGLWVMAACVAVFKHGMGLDLAVIQAVLKAVTTSLVLLLLHEWNALLKPRLASARILTIFLFLLYLILPPLFSYWGTYWIGLSGMVMTLGNVVSVAGSKPMDGNIWLGIMVDLALLVGLGTLVANEYAKLLRAKRAMLLDD